MRDPRNWVRPAAALVVGGAAGAALVVLRARRREHAAPAGLDGVRGAAERALADIERETRRLGGGRSASAEHLAQRHFARLRQLRPPLRRALR